MRRWCSVRCHCGREDHRVAELAIETVARDEDLACSIKFGDDESIAIGRKLMEQMRSDKIEFGITECSSCKMQMEQQSTTPTLHPLKVLALAYGLMPEIRRRFKPNLKKRLTS